MAKVELRACFENQAVLFAKRRSMSRIIASLLRVLILQNGRCGFQVETTFNLIFETSVARKLCMLHTSFFDSTEPLLASAYWMGLWHAGLNHSYHETK
jgi:hypothetical protein